METEKYCEDKDHKKIQCKDGVVRCLDCNLTKISREHHPVMKAKQIHLSEDVIERLTIRAVKEKTTFKELVQKLLTEISKINDRNI